jgi:hypothetical protein
MYAHARTNCTKGLAIKLCRGSGFRVQGQGSGFRVQVLGRTKDLAIKLCLLLVLKLRQEFSRRVRRRLPRKRALQGMQLSTRARQACHETARAAA